MSILEDFIPRLPTFHVEVVGLGLGAMIDAQPQFKGSQQYVAPRPMDQWRLHELSGGPSAWRGPFW